MSFTHERFLIEAIEQCHLFKIITYIKHGHNIFVRNTLGQSLLVHVLKQNNARDPFFEKKRFQVFQFLITHCNLDPHLCDQLGKNVLNWATNLNCTQEALYLLRSYPGDIDILSRDQSGLCSLHYAIEHGNRTLVHAIVNYLLQYRLRFDIKDTHNNTPEELARKLGYDDLAEYLADASRSTVFLSREILLVQQRPKTNKTKATANTKSSTASLLSLSSTLSSDSSDVYNLIESKIEAAKNGNDWKTVAALRSPKKTSNERRPHQLPSIPTIEITSPATTSSSSLHPKVSPIHLPALVSSSGGESVHMLRLIEPQICSSYRQPFIPDYKRTPPPSGSVLPASSGQRRLSTNSVQRLAAMNSHRKRDSNLGSLHGSILHEGHPRSSISSVTKSRRQSILPARLSDGVGLSKVRPKALITVHN